MTFDIDNRVGLQHPLPPSENMFGKMLRRTRVKRIVCLKKMLVDLIKSRGYPTENVGNASLRTIDKTIFLQCMITQLCHGANTSRVIMMTKNIPKCITNITWNLS